MKEALNENRKKIIGYIAIFCSAAFLFSRAKFGYIYNDEPFILTLAHRLLKGDSLLIHEWQPSLLTGYLNYFITKVYFIFHSNTEGMVLNFRYIYVTLCTIVIFVLYRRISNYTKKPIISCFACIYLFLFSSLDIMTLSYNFYSLAGVMLCFTFVVTGNKKWEYFLSGIFYSIATLASPYLAIVFILYYLGYGIYKWIFKKEMNQKWEEVTLHLLSGVLLSVVLFVIFFFKHGGSVHTATQSLHYILTDSEYPSRSILTLVVGYITDILRNFKVYGLILCIFLFATFFDRKRKDLYFCLHLITFVILLPLLTHIYIREFNFKVAQIVFLGFHAIVVKNKNVNFCYLSLYIVGIIFSFVLYATSDLRISAIAMGLVVSGVASFFLIEDSVDVKEIIWKKIIISCVCIAQISSQIYLRIKKYYRDYDLKDNTYLIENSITKGLYVSKDEYDQFNTILKEVTEYIPKKSNLCVLSMQPWIFLENDGEYGTYSPWCIGSVNYKIERLKAYYALFPNKYPEYVYVIKDDYSDMYLKEVFIGYSVLECDNAYILTKD